MADSINDLFFDDKSSLKSLESNCIEWSVEPYLENDFYQMRLWVEMKFWTEIDGTDALMEKPQKLLKTYKSLRRRIPKRSILQSNAFYYCMPNAYKRYLDENITFMGNNGRYEMIFPGTKSNVKGKIIVFRP